MLHPLLGCFSHSQSTSRARALLGTLLVVVGDSRMSRGKVQNIEGGTMDPSARILLVDDDEDLRVILLPLLESRGYDVVEASDCSTALQLLRDRIFDVVLLDITLPDRSGFGVLEFVAENHIRSKVIMMTGTSGLENAVRSATLGVMDYITKPFTPHYLIRSIQHALAI